MDDQKQTVQYTHIKKHKSQVAACLKWQNQGGNNKHAIEECIMGYQRDWVSNQMIGLAEVIK